jgi:hypothetical protein
MRRLLLLLVFVFALATGSAEAVSINDIIALSRAGLGDEVLLALIEVEGSVFTIDKSTLTKLKEAGVSERVIVAMVKSGRTRPPEPEPGADAPATDDPRNPRESAFPPEPQVVVIEHDRPIVQQVLVPVAVPVYVPVVSRRSFRPHAVRLGDQRIDTAPDFGVHLDPLADRPHKKAEPVYWGWGGKPRPDGWKVESHGRDRDR